MKGLRAEVFALALAGFLAPIVGGQVSQEAFPLSGNVLAEIFGGPALPLVSRAMLAALVLGTLAYALVKRQVSPVPGARLVVSLALLVGLLGLTSFVSEFPSVSTSTWLTWILYAGGFGLAVAVSGREKGPVIVLGSVAAGCGVVGARGLIEYMGEAATNPTWRVFGGWNNPNGVASMVLGGALIAIAVGSAVKGPWRWGTWLCGGLSLATLWLTQSKGGLAAMLVGILCLVVLAFVVKRPKILALGTLVTILVAAVAVVGVRPHSAKPGPGGGPRVFQAASTEVQSADFRVNLWKSAADLAMSHPVGIGAGNFRFFSAQPGLSDQTTFAHQSFLQVACEGSLLAMLALVYFLLRWLSRVVRTNPYESDTRRLLKAGAVAAVVAWCAHGFFESNLYYTGLGLVFFIVVGVGVQFADDLSSPEWSPSWLRASVALSFCLAPLLAMVMMGQAEIARATFLADLGTPQLATQAERLEAVGDPESLYLVGVYASRTLEERLDRLDRATAHYPRTKWLRALARTQLQAGKPAYAIATLQRALRYDPYGLPTLAELMRTQDADKRFEDAEETARQIINVEHRPSYLVRAIPEIIPTETFEARVYLAERSHDPEEKIRLFGEAVQGYKKFLAVTVPQVLAIGDLGGIDRQRANEIMMTAQAANAQLVQALKDAGKLAEANKAQADDQLFVKGSEALANPK